MLAHRACPSLADCTGQITWFAVADETVLFLLPFFQPESGYDVMRPGDLIQNRGHAHQQNAIDKV